MSANSRRSGNTSTLAVSNCRADRTYWKFVKEVKPCVLVSLWGQAKPLTGCLITSQVKASEKLSLFGHSGPVR